MMETTLSENSLLPSSTDGVLSPAEPSAPIADQVMKVLYMVVGTAGIIGNGLVVITLTHSQSMRKRTHNIFITHQAVIDLVSSVCIIMSRNTKSTTVPSGVLGQAVCILWQSDLPLWTCFLASVLNLMALTIERYTKIVHPISHKIRFSRNVALSIFVSIWLFSFLYHLVIYIPSAKVSGNFCFAFAYPSQEFRQTFSVLTFTMEFPLPVLVFLYCYLRMFLALRATPVSGVQTQKERARRNILKMLCFTSVTYVICWALNAIIFLMFNFGYDLDFTSPMYHFSVILAYTNSAVNIFIYIFRYDEFRSSIRHLLKLFNRGRVGPASVTISATRSGRLGGSTTHSVETNHCGPLSGGGGGGGGGNGEAVASL